MLIAWSKHGLRPVKTRKWSLKNRVRAIDVGIGDAMHRRSVISVTRPRKAHHSQCYGGASRRVEVSSGSIGLLIHPVNRPTADAWSRHWVRCIDEARE